jgi:2-keto-4-pentenoate hydratase/2-oxohepta-3-ene-1,7-dioic acid hydratase in catechol pathway
VIITDAGAVDVAAASGGTLPSTFPEFYDSWDALRSADLDLTASASYSLDELGPPSPRPRQVFAIGLNYASHAAESGMALPTVPATFTKYPSSLTGPFAPVPLSSEVVDYEVEIVVVMGRTASHVDEADAWDHVAGLTVGQDYSDRGVQFAAGSQFSLGKSFYGYGPTGPWLVTPDELADPDDLELSCTLNGEQMQRARSNSMIFPIPQLIAQLSAITPLWPGDLIFTGTPEGVGISRQPAVFLKDGDVVESTIEGVGTIHNLMKGSG